MPGAAHQFAVPRHAVVAWFVGFGEAHDLAAAEIGALVRATIGDGEEFALDVEEGDVAAGDLHQLGLADIEFIDLGDDVTSHSQFNP